MGREGPPIDQVATMRAGVVAGPGSARPQLLVIAAGAASTHPLPDSGEVVVGRTPECTVPIDDPSISRRHARIVMGATTTIEDLGSANGTRLRGEQLQAGKPVALAPGEIVDLGSVMITLQHGAAPAAVRRIWSHGYFEVRLEDECTRSARAGGEFGLVRVHVEPRADAAARTFLSDVLQVDDILGIYGPGEYEALLVDASVSDAEDLSTRIRTVLGESEPSVKVGLACFPRDGRGPYEIAAHASTMLRGRPSSAETDVVVQDGAMLELHRLVERVAAGNISVLLLGETGVGKEVLAATVHRLSPRSAQPFLRLNCAALTESLLESELFGHEKGAFTGAMAAKPGLLESADGGTVFLDEIGELPMSTQVKLLRVLEDRLVQRVGGLKSKPIDVRFVAATNRDLEQEIARGGFRQDLFFRINGISVVIPPLRERPVEIPVLARAFAGQAARQLGREVPDIAPDAMALLHSYSWPGNIRELRNLMERAVLLCGGRTILAEHLPVEKMTSAVAPRAVPRSSAPPSVPPPPTAPGAAAAPAPATDPETSVADRMRAQVQEAHRQAILDALEKTAGNQTEAAKVLGVSRRTMSTWLDEYGIARPRKKR